MITSELTDKFADLEARVAEEKGAFVLFALFMREEVPDRWDLIVSAPWIGDDKRGAVDYLIGQIKSRLGEQGCPASRKSSSSITFFGLPVKQAYIITSKRPPTPAVA
jgi:hypothetical protein